MGKDAKDQEWETKCWKNLHLAYHKYAVTFGAGAAGNFEFRKKSLGGAIIKSLTPKKIGNGSRYRVEIPASEARTGARVQAKPSGRNYPAFGSPKYRLKYNVVTGSDLHW